MCEMGVGKFSCFWEGLCQKRGGAAAFLVGPDGRVLTTVGTICMPLNIEIVNSNIS